jgi:hypothetical protein
MGSKTIVDVSQIEETIKNIPKDSFTVLDFIEAFRKVYPEDWGRLVERSGLFGTKRRYTVATYLSNRPDVYLQKTTQFLCHSLDTRKASSRITAELPRMRRKSSGGLG